MLKHKLFIDSYASNTSYYSYLQQYNSSNNKPLNYYKKSSRPDSTERTTIDKTKLTLSDGEFSNNNINKAEIDLQLNDISFNQGITSYGKNRVKNIVKVSPPKYNFEILPYLSKKDFIKKRKSMGTASGVR